MPKSYLPLVIALSLGLAACSDEQTAKLQQSASAAIGAVHATVEEASAPVGELKQQASAALGVAAKVGQAAAILDPELKEQMDELKQQASAAKDAVRALQSK